MTRGVSGAARPTPRIVDIGRPTSPELLYFSGAKAPPTSSSSEMAEHRDGRRGAAQLERTALVVTWATCNLGDFKFGTTTPRSWSNSGKVADLSEWPKAPDPETEEVRLVRTVPVLEHGPTPQVQVRRQRGQSGRHEAPTVLPHDPRSKRP